LASGESSVMAPKSPSSNDTSVLFDCRNAKILGKRRSVSFGRLFATVENFPNSEESPNYGGVERKA